MIERSWKDSYNTLLKCARTNVATPSMKSLSISRSRRRIHTTPSSSPPPARPLVGLGVFILHPTHPLSTHSNPMYLLGHRINSFAANTWGLPGGHLEFGETFEEGASREVLEETGLHIPVNELKFWHARNLVMKEEKTHFVSIFMVGIWDGKGDGPRVMEKEKCRGWKWVGWEETKRWVEGGEGDEGGKKLFPGMGDLIGELKGLAPRF
ncbi:hypothetical protein SBOR_3261 [Sclerotinia borealis F-4128]|uniref:Nudix hydrolase domain-containing protein n=1 Tax=Sclerotinia borealis (strain F-4128) TaxID=1432307 RepID=W9CP04_SCLBF|nr:hypothetical protein SBOR_3261 [Sclerotinia borealis F-4128]